MSVRIRLNGAKAMRKTRRQKDRKRRIESGWLVCKSPEARKWYEASRLWWEKRKRELPSVDPIKERKFNELLSRLRAMNWGGDDRERVRAAAWAVETE